MSQTLLKIFLSIFGESFIKRLIMRLLVSLEDKVAKTDNDIDDMILKALIEAFSGEVDDDKALPEKGIDVIHSQRRASAKVGDPRSG